MKKYIANKNFIPREFILERNKAENIRNKRMILILLIINFVAIPKSIVSIKNLFNKGTSVEVLSSNVEITNNKKEELINILDYIRDDIVSCTFSNNSGTIEVENKDTLYYLEEKANLKINSIRKLNDRSYLVEVKL